MVTADQESPPPPAADLVHPPRVVVADRGAAWIVDGWDLFKADPWQWLMLCVVYLIITFCIGLIPYVNKVTDILAPLWTAGMLLACQSQQQKKPATAGMLFQGFVRQPVSLLLCGLFQVGATWLLYELLLAGPVEQIKTVLFHGKSLDDLDMQEMVALSQNFSLELLDKAVNTMELELRLLFFTAILLPVIAAAWFAPALIVLGGQNVVNALRLSLLGTMKNFWPFAIYGLCGLLLCLLLLFTFGMAILVLVPIMYLSIYLSYRDIYID